MFDSLSTENKVLLGPFNFGILEDFHNVNFKIFKEKSVIIKTYAIGDGMFHIFPFEWSAKLK